MSQTWQDILQAAGQKTDAEFASQLSSLTHLTDDEINTIAPTNIDKVNLTKLLKVVNDSTLNNSQKADAIKNATDILNIAVPLISKLL